MKTLEFWDKIHLNCAEYSDNMLHAVIELDSTLDYSCFNQAFIRAMELNSVLSSELCSNGKRYYYAESNDLSSVTALYDKGESIEEYSTRLLLKGEKTQVKAGVFRADGRDTIVVVMNRIVADTIWLNRFVEELVKAYNDLNYKVEPVPNRCFKHFFKRFSLRDRYFIAKLKPFKLPKNIRFAHYPTSKSEGEKRAAIVKRVISDELMDNVRLYSKHIGVSLDDILIAAYVRSIKEHVESDRAINIDCAIDLRNYFPDQEPDLFTNYISHTNCNIGYDIGDELIDTIFKVNLALQHTRNSFPGLDGLRKLFFLSHISPDKLTKMNATKRYTRSALLFINNGEIKEERLGDAKITNAFTVNSIKNSRFAELNLSVYGRHAVISLPIYGNIEDIDTAERIVDNMIGQLDALKVIRQYK